MHFSGFSNSHKNVVKRSISIARSWRFIRAQSSTSGTRTTQRLLDWGSFQPREEPNAKAQNIAILGGGITGLVTAFDITRTIPNAKVTIYERDQRLGGWLNSETLAVDGGEVLFEWGPRTLRPDIDGAGRATANLIANLKLHDSVIGVSKRHPASLNRFIYYPDHLTRMPGPVPRMNIFANLFNIFNNFYPLLTEPIFSGILGNLVAEPTVAIRPSHIEDESVGDFLRRRFGKTIADNLASALFHGIYAGDIYKLSARTIIPMLWHLETRDPQGSGVILEMGDVFFRGHRLVPFQKVRFYNLAASSKHYDVDVSMRNKATALMAGLKGCSAYTFDKGLETLSRRLTEVLTGNPNVAIKTSATVDTAIYTSEKEQIKVITKEGHSPSAYDYVVSSLRPSKMRHILDTSAKTRQTRVSSIALDACAKVDRAVNVMVVNLYYSNPDLIPDSFKGFGYLIPRSVAVDQNPERALGVIFGSETSGPRGSDAIRKIQKPAISDDTMSELRTRLQEEDEKAEVLLKDAKEQLSKSSYEQVLTKMQETKAAAEVFIAEMEAEHQATQGNAGEMTLRLGQDTAPGTKLTVMLGGHWWDEWTESDLPDENAAIEMAKNVLARHLKIFEAPVIAKAKLNRNAIPQYPVGYRSAMSDIHEGLKNEFRGRFKVAGPWWQGGVGVNDCIKKARETVFAIREGWDDKTGLEEYTENEKWCLVDSRTDEISMDPMNK